MTAERRWLPEGPIWDVLLRATVVNPRASDWYHSTTKLDFLINGVQQDTSKENFHIAQKIARLILETRWLTSLWPNDSIWGSVEINIGIAALQEMIDNADRVNALLAENAELKEKIRELEDDANIAHTL